MADRSFMSKPQRACDQCRKRKIRCDNSEFADGDCSPCLQHKLKCTFQDVGVPRTVPKWYVTELEERVRRLEALLEELHPGEEFPKLGKPVEIGSWMRPGQQRKARTDSDKFRVISFDPPAAEQREASQPIPNLPRVFHPCYGEAQPYQLVQAALEKKYPTRRAEMLRRLVNARRPYFWSPPPWEHAVRDRLMVNKYVFPPAQLIPSLIDLYFDKVNLFFPLLHRPTITEMYRRGEQDTNCAFATALMLICAIGAHWSDDPQVTDNGNPHTSGWKYFDQVQQLPIMMAHAHSVQCLQVYALVTMFLLSCSSLEVAWSVAGFGIRVALKLGLHTRKNQDLLSRKEIEIQKRVFWVLVVLDRTVSGSLARPFALYEEEIDVDLPLEVDDDYWFVDGKECFQQPAGIPSLVCCFNSLLGLQRLQSTFMRKMNMDGYEHRHNGQPSSWKVILEEHDQALYQWHAELPPHLRWGPDQPNMAYLQQATGLLSTYYLCFIGAHRASLHNPSCFVTSISAAQACARLFDQSFARCQDYGTPLTVVAVLGAGLILQFGVWLASSEPLKRVLQDDVKCCFRLLTHLEKRWLKGGRHADVLRGAMEIENEENDAQELPPTNPGVEPVLNLFDQQAHFPTLIQYDDSRYYEPPPYQFNPYADGRSYVDQFAVPVDANSALAGVWNPPENEAQMEQWQYLSANAGLQPIL